MSHEQNDHDFDQAMRRLHAQAVDQVSPATRARLRVARQTATTPATAREPRRGWVLATSFAAVSALAIGMLLRPSLQAPAVTSPAPTVAAASTAAYDADTALATLDENPDLYLWLASNDDAMPALDQ